jgi:hypothetical protein
MILAMEFVATFCTVDAGVSPVLLLYFACTDEDARACIDKKHDGPICGQGCPRHAKRFHR